LKLWVRADIPDSAEKRKEIVTVALESGVDTIIVRPEDEGFSSMGDYTLLINDGGKISGNVAFADIQNPKDQEKALEVAGKADAIILRTSDWTVIPLENMIAGFRNTGTEVMACASDIEQAELFADVLQKGVDGIVTETEDCDIIRRFAQMSASGGNVSLSVIEVLDTKKIGMGDRVCVDTITDMTPGEGILTGSSALCLFLIQSESEENGYVAARPFRVNAGAVHAYLMVPGDRTRYLSELRAGDPLILTNTDGRVRSSSVGRCKIEQRPMMLLEAYGGDHVYSVVLQNAETVKVCGPDGSKSVTALKKGDRVYAKLSTGGRHFGMEIEETVKEI